MDFTSKLTYVKDFIDGAVVHGFFKKKTSTIHTTNNGKICLKLWLEDNTGDFNAFYFHDNDQEIADKLLKGKENRYLFVKGVVHISNKDGKTYRTMFINKNDLAIDDGTLPVIFDKSRLSSYSDDTANKIYRDDCIFDIAGVTHGELENVLHFVSQSELKMIREQDNEYDPFAVLIICSYEGKDYKLGYVPASISRTIGKMLDEGNTLKIEMVKINEFDSSTQHGLKVKVREN